MSSLTSSRLGSCVALNNWVPNLVGIQPAASRMGWMLYIATKGSAGGFSITLKALTGVQEDTMKAQGELKQQLDTVGQDVENARDDVAGVHTDLNKLGDNMTLLQQQQSYTSEGIYILCRCSAPLFWLWLWLVKLFMAPHNIKLLKQNRF